MNVSSPQTLFFILPLLLLLGVGHAGAYEAPEGGPSADAAAESAARQFTFSWQFLPGGSMAPRGGTTRGEGITLSRGPGEAWQSLREPGLSARERDRRAILAMAGPYRTSFDFIETVGFTADYTPDAPYQSWGTEYVYVVADEPGFISLQHIMVIRFAEEDGEAPQPMVVKHWRQDWHYEGERYHVFTGHRRWQAQASDAAARAGTWVQSVYQVDDSPRYAARGKWTHTANFSSWSSDETWRPLPRREFSVRDDYQVMIGTNLHTITPTGWVQEEHNLKAVLDESGEVVKMLAREVGLARYERIEDFDWSPGDEYWQRTAPFWRVVREAWRDLFAGSKGLTVQKRVNDVPMFVVAFQLADELTEDGFDPRSARRKIDEALAPYIAE